MATAQHTALIALGGNLGDVRQTFDIACVFIANLASIQARSKLYRSKALTLSDMPAPDYLNAAIAVQTTLTPEVLLQHLHTVEDACGRTRSERWGSRTLDLDLLTYEQLTIHSPTLQLPHPEIQHRLFVLQPLQDISAHWRHPVLGQNVSQLIAARIKSGNQWLEGETWSSQT